MFEALITWMFQPNTYNDLIVYLILALIGMLSYMVYQENK